MVFNKICITRLLLRVTLFIMFVSTNSFSAVKLPAIFSDHMVLQQKTKVQFWGWADAGEMISINPGWTKETTSIKTDASGKWKLSIQTPSAGGPYTITVNGYNSIVLKDVLVGEVWVCSGQSNMVFSLKSSNEASAEIAVSDFPQIRYFSVKRQYGPHVFNDSPGSVWEKTSPETAASFSAVAYYFAKKIHQDVNVPVGIVYAAWGGTPAEAWTPETVLQDDAMLSLYPERWNEIQQNAGKDSIAYYQVLKEWEKNKQTSNATVKKPQLPKTFYYFKRPWREPGVLFNGMINPIIPYSVQGILWYQGESNVAYADEYYQLFRTMINSWRDRWNQKSLSFYFVQIAPFGYSDMEGAARLREAQYNVMKNVKETGMAVTVDVGNMKDIHFIHKREVGERLALIALAKNYGYKQTIFSGPTSQKAFIRNNKVHVKFDQKLFTTNGQKAQGFELGYKMANSDSIVFVKAASDIKNDEVIVWSEKVKKPTIVRYAWLQIGQANLMNKEQLPASPFKLKIKP